MSDDTADNDDADGDGRFGDPRDRIESGADRAVSGFDDRVVDVLSWVLDTETRARIYVYLRQHPWSTSEEVAEGTGLYPSTVREALAELADEDRVSRRKRESEGAGNNPYEYTAIAPSELVREAVTPLQDELNAVCNLGTEEETDGESEPVSIEVTAAEASGDDTTEEEPAGD
ncbi:MAG: ArsR family transcriptional regulator [Halobacteriaceae archaeon]